MDSMALDEGGPLLPTAKALLQFQTEPNEEVLVKVGVSAVDMDGARKNVEAEISGWDFDGVRRAARQQWNTYLSKIDIDTKDNDQRTMFYTALLLTGHAAQLIYRCRRTLLWYGLEAPSRQGGRACLHHFSLWTLPCLSSADDDYRSRTERGLHPFAHPEVPRGRRPAYVGTGRKLYGYHDWLSCSFPHSGFVCKGIP